VDRAREPAAARARHFPAPAPPAARRSSTSGVPSTPAMISRSSRPSRPQRQLQRQLQQQPGPGPGRRRVRRSTFSAAMAVAVATGAAVAGSCPAVSTSPPQCPSCPARRWPHTQEAETRLVRSCRRRARRSPGPSRMCARFSRPRPICKTSPAHPPLPLALVPPPLAPASGSGSSSSNSSTSLPRRQRAPRRHSTLALFSPPCIRLHPCLRRRPCPCRTRPPRCTCFVWSPGKTDPRRRTGRPVGASLRRLPRRWARMPPRLNRRSLRVTHADCRSDMFSLLNLPYMKPSIFFLSQMSSPSPRVR